MMNLSEEESVEVAMALSLAESWQVPQTTLVREDAESQDEALDEAIALSLDEEQWVDREARETWTCVRCTLDNENTEGRCSACGADRAAPFTAAPIAAGPQLVGMKRKRCGLPGCARSAETPDGFCTSEHARRARERRLLAPATEDVERTFIGRSGDHSVSLLTKASPDRAQIADHFLTAWRKHADGIRPRVQHVYRVSPPPWLRERYDRYASAVGNTRRRYHGTSSSCSFGSNIGAAPCESDDCALCGILSSGFKLDRAFTGPLNAQRALRYGRGIYLSSTSGKSNDYAARTERLKMDKRGRQERWRCMLVCSVAAGRAFCTTAAELDLPQNKPPPGYDCVVGEVGENLNYDEIVVYREDAVITEYIITYTLL